MGKTDITVKVTGRVEAEKRFFRKSDVNKFLKKIRKDQENYVNHTLALHGLEYSRNNRKLKPIGVNYIQSIHRGLTLEKAGVKLESINISIKDNWG